MRFDEVPVLFPCAAETLVGILARPETPAEVGVVVIVGGPQYRVGSHRQFVHLSRHLAAAGIACLRFDYRGMGDATGVMRTFEEISDDIAAAVDVVVSSLPAVKRVVLWGLCDAASAACFYAPQDPRVAGVALLNPWVRTEAGEAAAYLKHYYWRRVLDRGFWAKVLRGKFGGREALAGLRSNLKIARARTTDRGTGSAASPPCDGAPQAGPTGDSLPERMARSLGKFAGRVLVVLSGNDLVAAEFSDFVESSAAWRVALAPERTARSELPAANHTFASEAWREEVARVTAEWVQSLAGRPAAEA
jgi:exosortase A-associated hydrolase 1